MDVQLDPQRLDDFARHLRLQERNRIPLDAIWESFRRTFPSRPQGADERHWLAAALQLLVSRGVIVLPPQHGRRWDQLLTVPLPTSIDITSGDAAPRVKSWKSFPWHARLAWVADLPTLTPEEETFLRRVHEGLVQGTFNTLAPLKYRSLQLTGHEKRLQGLRNGRCFYPGRLSLELLGCFEDVPPLPTIQVSDRPRLIIFENAGPYAVARQVLSNMPDPPYGHVGYAEGRVATVSIKYLKSLPTALEAIHYVGDLDAHGLDIALKVQAESRNCGLPTVIAAPGIHVAMLNAAATFGFPNGWLMTDRQAQQDRKWTTNQLLSFLSGDIRAQVEVMLENQRRIPEEVLGPTEMRTAFDSLPCRQNAGDNIV